ncbi:hypothetical protein ACE41H_10560 [Paenibacillus enshidis]|uniref:Uncharacterized protein n=2 Tax=Paenibacillus TaxID=44249 RepID=A0ABV5ASN8_9BACL
MKVKVISDFFNGIFTVRQPHPDLYVDYNIWNKINMGLHEEYTLPDQTLLSLLLEEGK